jgi:predicted extracellular nuclease
LPRFLDQFGGLALAPGLLFFAALISGCGEQTHQSRDAELCVSATTPIREIQGSGYRTPLLGSRQVVAGAVTWVVPDSGYYVETPGDYRPGKASRAIFIDHPPGSTALKAGQHVALIGEVTELGSQRDTMTALTGIERWTVCEDSLPLPLTETRLPLDSRQREAFEGMRLVFEQELSVTDVYSRYRGEITLSAGSPLRIPTEDIVPGEAAHQAARSNRNNAIDARLADPNKAPAPVGSRYRLIQGVLGHDGRDQLLLMDAAEIGTLASSSPPEAREPGTLRVVNANLLNFFNGDGRGGGFPTERGAENPDDFDQQQDRIRTALAELQPDLLAVQELENDGYGPDSAARSLEALLEQAVEGNFATVGVPDGRLGGDVISVGLFYRTSALTPVGPPQTLDSDPFRQLSRQPLAQLFREPSSGETLLVAVNHLKSKGSCPEDGPNANRDDGQGCWNRARTEAVRALLPWLQEVAEEAGTDRLLVLGDMNAYRMEDPIRAFREGGYLELVETLSGLPQYSYRFFGQAGTLDYAFATPALADTVRRAFIWHINSDWPRNMDLPQPWLRMSDHDPVVVDLQFGGQP